MSYVCTMKFKSKNKTYNTKNNSTGVKSTQLLNILQKMLVDQEGSVTYIYEDNRVENIHTHELSEMKDVIQEGRLQVKLNPVFFEERSPNELVEIFETTMLDLGANRYILS